MERNREMEQKRDDWCAGVLDLTFLVAGTGFAVVVVDGGGDGREQMSFFRPDLDVRILLGVPFRCARDFGRPRVSKMWTQNDDRSGGVYIPGKTMVRRRKGAAYLHTAD